MKRTGLVKVDEAYAEAVSKFFSKTFEQACKTVKDCHRYKIVGLMDTTPEIAESKTQIADEYVRNNLKAPFLPAMYFTHEPI